MRLSGSSIATVTLRGVVVRVVNCKSITWSLVANGWLETSMTSTRFVSEMASCCGVQASLSPIISDVPPVRLT